MSSRCPSNTLDSLNGLSTTPLPRVFHSRRSYSEERVDLLRSRVSAIPCIGNFSNLCIYITGSYGRLEASRHADIDLFFVCGGSAQSNPVSRIDKVLLDAAIIETCRNMGFPEPSNDGQFLQIHYLDDIQKDLGSPADDFRNYFTARLCLLLESRPIYNDDLYPTIIREIISAYFRDYHNHIKSFRPIFVVNDIIRYWKTVCLNYEHRRNRPNDDLVREQKTI